jgi:alpha-1,2-mannosyltransferase
VLRLVGDPTRREVRWTLAGGAAVLLAVLVVLLTTSHFIDLDVYRAAAGGVLHGDPYSVTGPDGLPFTYPVFSALVFVPFAVIPRTVAQVAMTLLSFAALGAIMQLILRRLLPDHSDRSLLLLSVPATVITVSAHPVLDTLMFGQVNLILMAMVLVDVLVVTGRGRGVLVGLATGIKLTPGLFIVYYLVTGQRRAAATAALTSAGTVALGFAVRPHAAWAFWTNYVLDPARPGNVTYAGNQSLLAITARLMRRPDPPHALTWGIVAAIVVVALLIARSAHRAGDQLVAVSAVAAAALLASPISWSHHWVWFIPAIAVVAAWAYRAGGGWRWWVLGVATLVVWSGPMRFTPKNQLRELADNFPQQLLANSFGLLAVAFLIWAGYVTWSRRGGAGAGTGAGRGGRAAAGAGAGARGDGSTRGGDDVDHEPQRPGGVGVVRVGVGELGGDV